MTRGAIVAWSPSHGRGVKVEGRGAYPAKGGVGSERRKADWPPAAVPEQKIRVAQRVCGERTGRGRRRGSRRNVHVPRYGCHAGHAGAGASPPERGHRAAVPLLPLRRTEMAEALSRRGGGGVAAPGHRAAVPLLPLQQTGMAKARRSHDRGAGASPPEKPLRQRPTAAAMGREAQRALTTGGWARRRPMTCSPSGSPTRCASPSPPTRRT